MKVYAKSWHARFYRATEDDNGMSICKYWGSVLFVLPLFYAIFGPFYLLLVGIEKIFSGMKLPKIPRPTCPFGKVEIVDTKGE